MSGNAYLTPLRLLLLHPLAIPTGKVPVLMVDGNPLPQSLAIARYLARLAGIVPENPLEAAYCDALTDTLSDVATEGYKIM